MLLKNDSIDREPVQLRWSGYDLGGFTEPLQMDWTGSKIGRFFQSWEGAGPVHQNGTFMSEHTFADAEPLEREPVQARWVTMREAARALNVSLSTIRRQVQAGELPAKMAEGKHGERWLIDLGEKCFGAEESTGDSQKPDPPQPEPELDRSFTLVGPVEPVQPEVVEEVVPLAAHLQIVRLLDEERAERREAQLGALRLERRLVALEVELQTQQRALAESSEATRAREEEHGRQAQELKLAQAQLARWEERRRRPWWQRIFDTGS